MTIRRYDQEELENKKKEILRESLDYLSLLKGFESLSWIEGQRIVHSLQILKAEFVSGGVSVRHTQAFTESELLFSPVPADFIANRLFIAVSKTLFTHFKGKR
jgi:hypothetical protein